MIDIDPGYQKLCGTDALAYVRYRHGDNDLVRAARQQDFLRQVRSQKGIRKLLKDGYQPSNLKKLARIFARYFDSDKGLRQKQELFRFAKTVLFTAKNPVREVQLPRRRRARQGQPRRVERDARGDRLRVPRREGLGDAARADRADRGRRQGVEGARQEPQEQAVVDHAASRRRAPRARTRRSSPRARSTSRSTSRRCAPRTAAYQGQEPRMYKIRDEKRGKHDAYRLVLAKGDRRRVLRRPGHDLAPAADPRRPARRRSSATAASCMVYRDGKRVRLVAWRTQQGRLLGRRTRSPSRSPDSR